MEPDKMLEQLKENEEVIKNELIELEQTFAAKKRTIFKNIRCD